MNAMNEERDDQIVSFLRREIVKMVLVGDIEHSRAPGATMNNWTQKQHFQDDHSIPFK